MATGLSVPPCIPLPVLSQADPILPHPLYHLGICNRMVRFVSKAIFEPSPIIFSLIFSMSRHRVDCDGEWFCSRGHITHTKSFQRYTSVEMYASALARAFKRYLTSTSVSGQSRRCLCIHKSSCSHVSCPPDTHPPFNQTECTIGSSSGRTGGTSSSYWGRLLLGNLYSLA